MKRAGLKGAIVKTSLMIAAVALIAGFGWAQAGKKPVNRKCPVKPSARIDSAVTSLYNGKVVGLCCSDCKEKWDKNPGAYTGALKEDANIPMEPEGSTTVKDTVDSGKSGPYLVVLLFADKGKRTQALVKALSDLAVEPLLSRCSYGKVEFVKDSDDAKLYGVKEAGTLLIIEPREEPPKILKTFTTATAGALVKEIKAGQKLLEAPPAKK